MRVGLIPVLGEMRLHSSKNDSGPRTPIQRHGFAFAALYGVIVVSIIRMGSLAAGIDPNVSMRDTYSTGFLALLLLGLGVASAVGYVVALAISNMLYRFRSFVRARLE